MIGMKGTISQSPCLVFVALTTEGWVCAQLLQCPVWRPAAVTHAGARSAAAGPRWGGMCLAAAAVTRPGWCQTLPSCLLQFNQCAFNALGILKVHYLILQLIAGDSGAGPLTPLRQWWLRDDCRIADRIEQTRTRPQPDLTLLTLQRCQPACHCINAIWGCSSISELALFCYSILFHQNCCFNYGYLKAILVDYQALLFCELGAEQYLYKLIIVTNERCDSYLGHIKHKT